MADVLVLNCLGCGLQRCTTFERKMKFFLFLVTLFSVWSLAASSIHAPERLHLCGKSCVHSPISMEFSGCSLSQACRLNMCGYYSCQSIDHKPTEKPPVKQ